MQNMQDRQEHGSLTVVSTLSTYSQEESIEVT